MFTSTVLHGNIPRLAFRTHDLAPRDISRDILSRALKVNLGKAVRGTFLATSCQEAVETATSSHRSRHLPGHRVRVAGSKPPNLRYPDTGPRQSELFR